MTCLTNLEWLFTTLWWNFLPVVDIIMLRKASLTISRRSWMLLSNMTKEHTKLSLNGVLLIPWNSFKTRCADLHTKILGFTSQLELQRRQSWKISTSKQCRIKWRTLLLCCAHYLMAYLKPIQQSVIKEIGLVERLKLATYHGNKKRRSRPLMVTWEWWDGDVIFELRMNFLAVAIIYWGVT